MSYPDLKVDKRRKPVGAQVDFRTLVRRPRSLWKLNARADRPMPARRCPYCRILRLAERRPLLGIGVTSNVCFTKTVSLSGE